MTKDFSFSRNHPYPDQSGVTSLFKFMPVNLNNSDRIDHLLSDCRLYHSSPSQFNDPFECKPYFRRVLNPDNSKTLRKHLIRIAKKEGNSNKDAEAFASKQMQNPKKLNTVIQQSVNGTLADLRICSFTTIKENLLFWSHYADSHKGICIEFDATRLPFLGAFKVRYTHNYPEAEFPPSCFENTFVPALTKSVDWAYENEYRTILVPYAKNQPPNDGRSFLLERKAIKNIYLGARIDQKAKELVSNATDKGPFNPTVWQSKLSEQSYKLEFEKISI